MADDDENRLWHELLEDSKINEMAHDLIQKFLSMGMKIDSIKVHWDNEGNFLSETRGEHFQRRIEDIKPPEKH